MRRAILLLSLASAAFAAPMLRLSNSVVGPVTVAPGSNVPVQTLQAYNAGDGTLSLSMTVDPAVTWVTASVGALQSCVNPDLTGSCFPLQFQLSTSGLAEGTYTAQVTVSDPHAVDAPQVIMVIVRVGPPEPVAVDRYMAAGTFYNTPLFPGDNRMCFSVGTPCPSVSARTQEGGEWLSIAIFQPGTIRFYGSYMIHLAPPAGMAEGTYHGTVSVATPSPARDIPVTMRVTTQPVAMPSVSEIRLTLAQAGAPITNPFLPAVGLSNSGAGALTVEGLATSGQGLSIQNGALVADPAGLAPGDYGGTLTFACNAVNCPFQVPVHLRIVPQGPPVLNYQGVVDNAGFLLGDTLAQGTIAIVTGGQLSMRAPEFAATTPIPTKLGGASVLVNNVLAPLFYSSSGQIAFQLPSATAPGIAQVQVVRDGITSNTVSVKVAPRVPRIVVITDALYRPIDPARLPKAGDSLIVWAIGMGATNPPLTDGVPASEPAPLTVLPDLALCVGTVKPSFAGVSSGSVGLFQVNATLPADLPSAGCWAKLQIAGTESNFFPFGK